MPGRRTPIRTSNDLLRRILTSLWLVVLLAACSATGGDPLTTAVVPSPATATIQAVAARTTAASDTPQPTLTSTVFPTSTFTPAPTYTATSTALPQPTATFSPLRRTPPTLMLHRSNPDFDSVAFLKAFVQILQQQKMHVVTYQDLSRYPDLSAAEQGRLFILTIDDVSLQAKIDPSIQQMIAILREAKYPAVLGIVTEGKLPDSETAAALKALAGEGWQLAMHTESHTDLHVLEQTSPYGARLEIRTCADKIFQATGVKPDTLVLPYGSMVEDFKILYREHVLWVVGIVGGEKYRMTHQFYYVGRDGPAGDAAQTYQAVMKRFNTP